MIIILRWCEYSYDPNVIPIIEIKQVVAFNFLLFQHYYVASFIRFFFCCIHYYCNLLVFGFGNNYRYLLFNLFPWFSSFCFISMPKIPVVLFGTNTMIVDDRFPMLALLILLLYFLIIQEVGWSYFMPTWVEMVLLHVGLGRNSLILHWSRIGCSFFALI